MHDWAPAHGAKATKALCEKLFPKTLTKEEWPSNSPDLNPIDYSIWSILSSKVSSIRHKSVESLKTALQKAWDEIPVEQLAAIVDQFPKRLKACISNGGGHIEQNFH